MLRTVAVAARNNTLLRGGGGATVTGSGSKRVLRINVTRSLVNQCAKLRPCSTKTILNKSTRTPIQWATVTVRNYADWPDHVKVPLPALSPTMEMGTIISWNKKVGDKLEEGDLLAEIETDKATMGFETPEEGYLAKILVAAGTKEVPIGKLVCIIVANESDVAAFKDFTDDSAGKAAPAPKAAAAAAAPVGGAVAPPPPPSPLPSADVAPPSGGRTYASPMAKRLAEQRQIRLQGTGSGLFGSITAADVERMAAGAVAAPAAAATAAAPAPGATYIDIPLSNVRGVIAKRLLQSKQELPHYYLTADICVDRLEALRVKFNKQLEKKQVKLSVNDFILKGAAISLQRVPEVNSSWRDTFIRQFSNVDISVAVASDKGLITPIVFGAESKGVLAISESVKKLVGKAREGSLQPHEFQGGTFSVSNLGMFGVSHFTAIINPPQSCILAVGTTEKRLVLDEDAPEGFKESKFMKVTLSCDHRVVDGAMGANWLKSFRECLENPESMIL